MVMIKEVVIGIKNMVYFWRVIWNYRWWDYGFTYDILVKDLELRYEKWGTHTHYVGDKFTKQRIEVVLSYYYQYKIAETWEDEIKYEKKFIQAYTRLLPRLWD